MVSALASSSVGFPFTVSVMLKVLVNDWDLLEEELWEKQNIYFVCFLLCPHQCPSSPAHFVLTATDIAIFYPTENKPKLPDQFLILLLTLVLFKKDSK